MLLRLRRVWKWYNRVAGLPLIKETLDVCGLPIVERFDGLIVESEIVPQQRHVTEHRIR